MSAPQNLPEDEHITITDLDTEPFAAGFHGIPARLKHTTSIAAYLRGTRIFLSLLASLLVATALFQPPLFSTNTSVAGTAALAAAGQPPIIDMTVHNGVVYITDFDYSAHNSVISAYRASNGKLLWRQYYGRYIISVLATNQLVYCLQVKGVYGRVLALDASNGIIRWAQKISIAGATQMSVSGDNVYLRTAEGMLYAVNGDGGHILWSFPTPGSSSPDAFVSVQNGFVSLITRQSVFYILRASDGKPIFHYTPSLIDAQLMPYPTVENGILYITDSDSIQARSASSGALRWKYRYLSGNPWFPVIQDGIVLVRGPGDALMALRGQDGKVLWKYATPTPITFPVISNGTIFLQLSPNIAIALRASDGTPLWRTALLSGPGASPSNPTDQVFSPPTIANNTFYLNFFPPGRTVYALRASDGQVLWRHSLSNVAFKYAPQVSNGVIYLGRDDSTIDAYNASNGRPLWSYHSPSPLRWYPLVDGGLMFARTLDDSLVVLRLSNGKRLWRYTSFM
jgi:outer membrane protein assembly factor BamB